MDFTFIPQYDGQTPKRKRLAKACESCRARKKRCHHQSDGGSDEPPDTQKNSDSSPSGRESDKNETNNSKQSRYPGLSARVQKGNSTHRFLSDLHPETRLLERTRTDGENRVAKPIDSVGVWVDKQEWEVLIRQRDAAKEAGLLQTPSSQENGTSQLIRPHSAQLAGLIDVYFKKIHPFLPLLDEAEFRKAHVDGVVPEPFVHALCLVAAKDKEAEEYLRLSDSSESISPRELCRSLHTSVKAAVAAPVRYDKITLTRMLALLSLHNEGSDGADEASLSLAQAMHHCQTLGLHLSASFPSRDGKITKRLFWSLWILDRLNAATNGRPIIMADKDIAIEPFQPGESGFLAFEILLRITGIVNDVIDFYRPGNSAATTGWEDDFPCYEEIVDGINAWDLPVSTLSTLHIAYLTVAILSHRSKGVKEFASTTPSHVRQSLAAIKIIRLMNPTRLKGLHALPILPYAISLALSVSYQHLRQDQLRHQQEDARADFEACFVILRELKESWSSLDAMSILSEKVLDELKRTPNIASFRIQRPSKIHRPLEDFSSACRHEGESVAFPQAQDAAQAGHTANGDFLLPDPQQDQTTTNIGTGQAPLQVGQGLFEGIDDIFGTYLDPNYPVNLDFLDDIETGDWVSGV